MRSVRVGDFVFSVGQDVAKVVDLTDPTAILANVPLPESNGGYYGGPFIDILTPIRVGITPPGSVTWVE